MKKLMLIMITLASFAACAPILRGQDINFQNLPAEDVKAIRKVIADKDYYQKRSEQLEKESAGWETSSNKWQKLYEGAMYRADVTQENRIKECDASKADLNKANFELHTQADADKQKIGELEFDNRKLRGERKWYFVAGFGTGAAAGAYGGYKAARKFSF